MELATLASGAVLLRRFRYPFLMLPIAVMLWYMGMDIVPALIMQGGEGDSWFYGAAWELRKVISVLPLCCATCHSTCSRTASPSCSC